MKAWTFAPSVFPEKHTELKYITADGILKNISWYVLHAQKNNSSPINLEHDHDQTSLKEYM